MDNAFVFPVNSSRGIFKRRMAMELSNKGKHAWESPQAYFRAGTADPGLPGRVEGGGTLYFSARSRGGLIPTGSAGVVTYYAPSRDVTVALMWALPLDYVLSSNMWCLSVVQGNQPASTSLFNQLYHSSTACKGDGNVNQGTLLDGDWTYEGSMGHSASPSLVVSIFSS